MYSKIIAAVVLSVVFAAPAAQAAISHSHVQCLGGGAKCAPAHGAVVGSSHTKIATTHGGSKVAKPH
jgi:hypothetical protein